MHPPTARRNSRRVAAALLAATALVVTAASCTSADEPDVLTISSSQATSSDSPSQTLPSDGLGPLTGSKSPPQRKGGTGPLADVQVFSGLSRTHQVGPIRYRQNPPVGGDHGPIWANCGFYSGPIDTPSGVHSLEHGVVWITYMPEVPDTDIEELRALVVDHPFLLVSAWDGDDLPSPIMLSAWGVQLGVDAAADPAVKAFVDYYEVGPQTPEPGAPCSGGIGLPDVQSRAPAGD